MGGNESLKTCKLLPTRPTLSVPKRSVSAELKVSLIEILKVALKTLVGKYTSSRLDIKVSFVLEFSGDDG